MTVPTTDICDEHYENIRVLDLDYRFFSGKTSAAGTAVLLDLADDNRIIFDVLKEGGAGKILVIKVHNQKSPAVVGEATAQLAVEHKWEALIIDGALRDTKEIKSLPVCIAATKVRPFRLRTENFGKKVKCLNIGGVAIKEGDVIVVDEDGMIAFEHGLIEF